MIRDIIGDGFPLSVKSNVSGHTCRNLGYLFSAFSSGEPALERVSGTGCIIKRKVFVCVIYSRVACCCSSIGYVTDSVIALR